MVLDKEIGKVKVTELKHDCEWEGCYMTVGELINGWKNNRGCLIVKNKETVKTE
ncbi:MAG: hypothetical protein PUF65_01735 [Lachnospiraceae bacterium]|nr:hypothetical protein [Lachnospiraceae bacterium]